MSESPGLPVTVSVLTGIGALTAATLWGQASGDISSTLLILDVAAGLASCALLPVLLRWPVPGALALAVLAALSPAATPASTYATLHVSLRRRFPMAAAVAGAGVAGLLIRGLWRPISSLSSLWWVVLVLVAEAALVGWGELSRARQALLASLREQARRAEAEQASRVAEARAAERASIAREMHDVLAHRLSLLATYAGALEYRPDASPEQLARAAGVVRASTHQALDELREVISVLRDDDSTAGIRPQPGLSDLSSILSPAITRRLMDRAVAESGTQAQAQAAFADLTAREREVVLGVAQGETNAEIAARLFMSVATVKSHITHILTKLDATNRTQIALLAHDAGLV